MLKRILAEALFWIHLIVFTIWFAIFLIPSTLWPKRVVFHFWFISMLLLIQLIMGLILIPKMRKYRIVCPLTSFMQLLRGHKLENPKNFDHSFVREFASRFKLKIPYGFVGFLIFLSFGVVSVQYILHLK